MAKLPFFTRLRALRHRNFQLFISGQLISVIGTWMQTVALSWLVYRLTGSAMLLGAVGFVSQIPILFLSPLGGHIADRHNRRRVVIITQVVAMILAFMVAVLTLTNTVRVWHLFVLGGLMGAVSGFDIPARQSLFVEMVGREDLMNAIALNASMFNASRMIGPAIAGILVARIGEGWCFMANAISYLAVIAGLFMMRLPQVTRTVHESLLQNIIEGFRFAAHTRPIRTLLMMLGVASLMGMPYVVLMPIFADQILHGGPRGLGILVSASGVGALAGVLLLATRSRLKGLHYWTVTCAAGFGISLTLFSWSRSFWLSAALLMPVGGFMMVLTASINTLLQSMVPDRLRGRVMSSYSMMFQGMSPFGALFAGFTAKSFGAPIGVTLGGMVCVAAAVIFGMTMSRVRGEMRELIRQNGVTATTPTPTPTPAEESVMS